jgi:hypothetical protein
MAQVNINDPGPRPTYTDEPTYVNTPGGSTRPVYDDASGARASATNNLTWAIAVVLIIAAIAIAVVYVAHNVHV